MQGIQERRNEKVKQFGKILKFELKNYAKNKAFVGVTLFLILVIAVIMFFPRITAAFESDEGSVDADTTLPVMLVRADDPSSSETVRETFAAAFAGYDVQITDEELDVIKEKITSADAECAFVMNGAASFTYYVNNLSMYDTNPDIATGVLQQIYQMNAMIGGGMSPEEAVDVMSIQIDAQVESLGKDQMQNFFYTYIMIFALYMVIMLYGWWQ